MLADTSSCKRSPDRPVSYRNDPPHPIQHLPLMATVQKLLDMWHAVCTRAIVDIRAAIACGGLGGF